MGSKMGPNYACLFVSYVEQQICEQYPGFTPQLHKRYIYDIAGAASCRREELEAFIDFVSNFHPALQFTSTITERELPLLDINLHISDDKIQTSIYYKETDNYYLLTTSISLLSIVITAYVLSLTTSFSACVVSAPTMMTSSWDLERCLPSSHCMRGYPCSSLENDLRRVATINRPDALRSSEQNDGTVGRVPLVLTYHSFNTQIRRFLLQNFRILSTDQQTRDIFPQPLFVAYKCDLNLTNMLVHSNDHSSTEQYGSCVCQRPRCHTCQYISSGTEIRGPNYSLSVRGHFTCQNSNLVYCTSCSYTVGQTSSASSVKLGWFYNLELFSQMDLTSILAIFELYF